MEIITQWAVANYFGGEIKTPARQLYESIDEMLESFECNQPADADDPRHGVGRRAERGWKTLEINAVVDPVNFRGEIRAPLAKHLAAVISFSLHEFPDRAAFSH